MVAQLCADSHPCNKRALHASVMPTLITNAVQATQFSDKRSQDQLLRTLYAPLVWVPETQVGCFCLRHALRNFVGKLLAIHLLLGNPDPEDGYYDIVQLVQYVALTTAEVIAYLPREHGRPDMTALDTLRRHDVQVAIMRTPRFAGHFVAIRRHPADGQFYVVDSVPSGPCRKASISLLRKDQEWTSLLVFREYVHGAAVGRLLDPDEIAECLTKAEQLASQGEPHELIQMNPELHRLAHTAIAPLQNLTSP